MDTADSPHTSRRALVRTAAWAAPAVAVAAAAPAYAATSGDGPLIVEQAEFFIHPWDDGTSRFVPRLTLYNPRSVAASGVVATIIFPSDEFTSFDDGSLGFPDLGPLDCGYYYYGINWLFVEGGRGFALILDHLLDAHSWTTAGTFAPRPSPWIWSGFDWANDPTVDRVALDVVATFEGVVSTTSAYLTRVDPPVWTTPQQCPEGW